jgi:methanogenic corrinoid protein MtbC1
LAVDGRARGSGLQEEMALAFVHRRLHTGDDSLLMIEACQKGMRQVGMRYERHECYLAGLIRTGEIFGEVMELLQPVVECQVSGQASGHVLLGTVEGDIHDAGVELCKRLIAGTADA